MAGLAYEVQIWNISQLRTFITKDLVDIGGKCSPSWYRNSNTANWNAATFAAGGNSPALTNGVGGVLICQNSCDTLDGGGTSIKDVLSGTTQVGTGFGTTSGWEWRTGSLLARDTQATGLNQTNYVLITGTGATQIGQTVTAGQREPGTNGTVLASSTPL